MKILHVSYYDIHGGAGIAAFRLCKEQREIGLDATMLVVEKFSDATWVKKISAEKVKKMKFLQKIEALLSKLFANKKNFMPHSFNLFSLKTLEEILQQEPDIVHLHWINGQMLSIREIAKLNMPVVWTLHDTWAYCGCEHHHLIDDKRFISGYKGWGIEAFIWKKKFFQWKNFNPVIVGPSSWITSEAHHSALFSRCRSEHIFNGIDFGQFKKISKNKARKYWHIPEDKKVIVAGAFSLDCKNKGGDLLWDVLANFLDAVIILIGKTSVKNLPKNIIQTGLITNQSVLSAAYSAGDVFLSTAYYDNLPNMLIESCCCGTPCVAIETGGVKDILSFAGNGIATSPEKDKLVDAIQFILDHSTDFSPSAEAFDIKFLTLKYKDLYNEIIINC